MGSVVIWILTAVCAVVVVATPFRLRREATHGGIRIGRGVQRIHTLAGVIAVLAWAALVHWGREVWLGDALMGVIGLAGFWITTFSGLMIMLRWLPTKGDTDRRSFADTLRGPVPSVIGHLAVLGATCYFCWAYVMIKV